MILIHVVGHDPISVMEVEGWQRHDAYYKFMHIILLYFLKLLQMTFIIIYIKIILILYYVFILITCNKKLNFKIIFD
jgi:hypothetical protein